MTAAEEMFDVCDEQDRVVGQAPRSAVHTHRWLHRAVHIFVFNRRQELLLHRRSAAKDEYPLRLTSSASGHLGAGETYEQAAPRELAEEQGLAGPLEYLTWIPASPETACEHTALYRLVTDDAPVPDPGEVESVEFAPLDEVQRRLAATPEDFSPPFRVLLRWYFENHPPPKRRSEPC